MKKLLLILLVATQVQNCLSSYNPWHSSSTYYNTVITAKSSESNETKYYQNGYQQIPFKHNMAFLGAGLLLGTMVLGIKNHNIFEGFKTAVIPSLIILPPMIAATQVASIAFDLNCTFTDAFKVRFFDKYKNFRITRKF